MRRGRAIRGWWWVVRMCTGTATVVLWWWRRMMSNRRVWMRVRRRRLGQLRRLYGGDMMNARQAGCVVLSRARYAWIHDSGRFKP